MSLLGAIEAVGGVFGLAALIGATLAYARVSGMQTSITVLTDANAGLIVANELGKTERAEMRGEFTKKLADQELECANKLHAQELEASTQIAELRGQVNVLTGGLAERIVTATAAALAKQGGS